jgi:hypothetical protein
MRASDSSVEGAAGQISHHPLGGVLTTAYSARNARTDNLRSLFSVSTLDQAKGCIDANPFVRFEEVKTEAAPCQGWSTRRAFFLSSLLSQIVTSISSELYCASAKRRLRIGPDLLDKTRQIKF